MSSLFPAADVAASTPTARSLDDILDALGAEFAERAEQYDRTGEFPRENFRRLHEYGLLSLATPQRYGGAGASLPTLARVIGKISKGDPSTGLILTMQYLFNDLTARSTSWPEGLRARVFESVVRDGALINGLRVEPALGTPARGGLPDTIARREPGGWRIDGRKIYSTGVHGLTWLSVWARTDETPPRIGGWLVPRDAPGVSVVENWDHLGMRATGSHEVVFDNVLVPLEYGTSIWPEGHHGARLDPTFALWNTVLVSTVYDAVARAARDWFVAWLDGRRPSNLDSALSSLPHLQRVVGEIDTLLFANRLLLDAAIAGQVSPNEAGSLKYLVSGNAIAAVQKAVEWAGNPGLIRANPLQRHLRDVLCSRIHTPQNDSILLAAGKAAFAARAGGASNGA
ncbi:MAG: acyl-CoA dehydrogenase [Methylocystaceae bacterium]|nr:MAG: acyl-CoA dehydrogenase [Methylocystaceae bacterium]